MATLAAKLGKTSYNAPKLKFVEKIEITEYPHEWGLLSRLWIFFLIYRKCVQLVPKCSVDRTARTYMPFCGNRDLKVSDFIH